MYEWFIGENANDVMGIFNIHHILGLIMVLVMVLALILCREDLRTNEELEQKVRYGIAISCIVSIIMLRIYEFVIHDGSFVKSMPFHFCSIAYIFGIHAMITRDKATSQLAYYMGFIGGTGALLFPGIKMGFPYYRFVEYFFSHGMLIVFMVYFLIIDNIKGDKEERKKFIIAIITLSIPMMIWNAMFKTEYFFLNGEVPNGWDLLLPKWPFYYPLLVTMTYIGAILADMIKEKYYLYIRKTSNID